MRGLRFCTVVIAACLFICSRTAAKAIGTFDNESYQKVLDAYPRDGKAIFRMKKRLAHA
ncbi:hypothetical protein ACFL0T_06280 [Candidatus Omnitrophota bacterium]